MGPFSFGERWQETGVSDSDDPYEYFPLEFAAGALPDGTVPNPLQVRSVRYSSPTLATEPISVDSASAMGVVLGVVLDDLAGKRCVRGSAAMIAPGVAITAQHVVSDIAKELVEGALALYCIGMQNARPEFWEINQIVLVHNTDLALLTLTRRSRLPSGYVMHLPVLSTRTPFDDEKLLAVGMIESVAPRPEALAATLMQTSGPVINTYLGGVDRHLYTGPTVVVKCAAPGGMSGGPVFDAEGYLVGIVTASTHVSPAEPELFAVSYMSLIYPALMTEFSGGWPVEAMPGTRTLYSLDRPRCAIKGREYLTAPAVAGGDFLYKPWR